MDEFENQPQQPESPQDANGTSRRNFLKVAVVSSAAAAAAVGGAGVAAVTLSSRAPTGLSKLLVLTSNLVSTKQACWTFTSADPSFVDNSSGTPFNKTEDVFLWAWFTGLSAAGSYTVSLKSPTPMPSWLTYNGNGAVVFPNLTGCPATAPTVASIASNKPGLPVSVTIGTQTSVLVWLQMHANNAPAGAFTMTLEMTNGSSYDHTATATAYFS